VRVLIVEDDALLGDGLREGLQQHGFTADWIEDGDGALHALLCERFDLAIIDIGLPRRSGISVLNAVRNAGRETPILMLTARDAVDDKINCLDAGADDYLVKPVDIDELAARLRALARRHAGQRNATLRHADLELDPAAHRVTVDGMSVELSRREFSILHALLHAVGTVLSRDHLEQSLYGWNEEIESNAVQVHVHNLRRKLGDNLIETVRGVGYVIRKQSEDIAK